MQCSVMLCMQNQAAGKCPLQHCQKHWHIMPLILIFDIWAFRILLLLPNFYDLNQPSATWPHPQFKTLYFLDCCYTFLPWEALETWGRIGRHTNYTAVLGVKTALHFTGQNFWGDMSMQNLKQQLTYEEWRNHKERLLELGLHAFLSSSSSWSISGAVQI